MFKSLLVTVSMISLFSVAAQTAEGYDKLPDVIGNISSFNIDRKLADVENMNLYGNVSVDSSTQIARLTVDASQKCAPGTVCTQYVRQILNVQLPVISVTANSCNATVITAQEDARRGDGALQTLIIVDNRTNDCKTLVALPAYEITYETEAMSRGGIVNTKSTFAAEQQVLTK